MREVYAALLRLADGGDAHRARALVVAWLRRRYGDLPADADRDRDSWRPAEGVTIEWSTLADDSGGDFLHDLVCVYPDASDETLRQRLTVTVGADGMDGWVLVRQAFEPVATVLVDVAETPPRRPELVGALVDHCACVDAGLRLRTEARRVGPADVAELAAFVMDTPSRMLPVLVLADPSPGRLAFDADALADLVVGVAHVAVVQVGAVEAFQREFGVPFGVEPGGARLFWPRWHSDDAPTRHPRWSRSDLAAGGDRPQFPRSIAARLFVVAATHVAEPSLRNRLRGVQARAHRQRLGSRLPDAAPATPEAPVEAPPGPSQSAAEPVATPTPSPHPEAALEVARLRAEVAMVKGDLDTVLHDYDAAIDEIEDIEREMSTIREERDRLFTGLLELGKLDAEKRGPATLAEAVAEAHRQATNIVYLPEAFASARRAQTRNPRKVLGVLTTLDRVARRWWAREVEGSLGQEMRGAGLDWAGGISETAAHRHGAAYSVRYRGENVQLGPHLRLDKGLRAYCYVDGGERVIVVGHVGEHLPGKRD